MGTAAFTLADPPGAAAARGGPVEHLLPLAGVYFSLGIFLLTGFMSRFAGLLLAGAALWELTLLGLSAHAVLYALMGIYFTLRGGGTWAMDVYVEKIQSRVRDREARERAQREQSHPADQGALV